MGCDDFKKSTTIQSPESVPLIDAGSLVSLWFLYGDMYKCHPAAKGVYQIIHNLQYGVLKTSGVFSQKGR